MDRENKIQNPKSRIENDLSGQVAVVTGATSGIGRAIARELAAAGAAVFVHGRNAERAKAVAAEIREFGAEPAIGLCELADRASHVRLIDEAWNWQGRVDVWVNNAGADILTPPGSDGSFDEKVALLWNTDVVPTAALSRLAGARMKAAGRGVVINMGWDGACRGMAGDTAQLFALAKGAIMAFSRSLAQSLAPEVRVLCVAPGWIRTAWGAAASAVWQERAARESLAQRWGEPEDVARCVRFLCSPAAAFVNGEILAVNGGRREGLPPTP